MSMLNNASEVMDGGVNSLFMIISVNTQEFNICLKDFALLFEI